MDPFTRRSLFGAAAVTWWVVVSRKSLVPFVLPADPTNPMEAATKQYVDANAGGGEAAPGTKLTALAAQTGASASTSDLIETVDVSDTTMSPTGTNKTMTLGNVITFLNNNGVGGGGQAAGPGDGTRVLDSFSGATDDAKLDAAIAWQQATPGKPIIRLAARRHDFNQPARPVYTGLKIMGTPAGTRNTQISPNNVPTWIKLGGSIGVGAAAWWVNTGQNYDVYFGDLAVEGTGVQGFMDSYLGSGGNLYSCQFHALSFNYMAAVFGSRSPARPCAMTAVAITGFWTVLNIYDTQFHIGGSDCAFWMDAVMNLGPGGATSGPAGGPAGVESYEIIFSNLSKTNVGDIFMSPLTLWRGLKVTGADSFLTFYGGTYEGYKPGIQGGLDKRAIGSLVRLEGGMGSFYGTRFGQCMRAPDASEGGYVHVTGGEWNFYGPQFYRGDTLSTVPCIYQTGGRVFVSGASRRQTESWANRPVWETSAVGGNVAGTGNYTSYCPDLSMQVQ